MSELTNIQILRSAVPHKRPDPSFLLDGQLAINYKEDDPGLFAKLQSGGLFKIGPAAYTTDGTAPNQNPGVGGITGNTISEEWNDGRGAFYSPIKKFWNGAAWQTLGGWDVDNNTGNLTCLKAINVATLEADAIRVNGPAIIAGDVTPNGTSCIYDMGKNNERWKGGYFCELDLQGDLAIGGDLSVGGDGVFGGDLSAGGDLTITGGATFGQDCTQDKFTVKMPTYLNCDVEVLGDYTGRNLTLTEDLKVEGDVDFGKGCGLSSTHFYSDVTFHCAVNFITYPLTVESLIVTDLFESQGNTVLGTDCLTDVLTVNSKSFFNCDSQFLANSQVGKFGLAAQPSFTTFGTNYFYQNIESGQGLILAAKGTSAVTVDTDPDNTMITKKWAEDMVADAVLSGGLWEVVGTTIKTRTPDQLLIPNGVNATVGLDTVRWKAGYFNDVYTNDLHLKNDRGSWTMIEEEDVLTLRNNKTGQRYAIMMTPYVEPDQG